MGLNQLRIINQFIIVALLVILISIVSVIIIRKKVGQRAADTLDGSTLCSGGFCLWSLCFGVSCANLHILPASCVYGMAVPACRRKRSDEVARDQVCRVPILFRIRISSPNTLTRMKFSMIREEMRSE